MAKRPNRKEAESLAKRHKIPDYKDLTIAQILEAVRLKEQAQKTAAEEAEKVKKAADENPPKEDKPSGMLRSFSVELKHCPRLTVEAESREDAYAEYLKKIGASGSDHIPDIKEL